jgi:hypothetical protein
MLHPCRKVATGLVAKPKCKDRIIALMIGNAWLSYRPLRQFAGKLLHEGIDHSDRVVPVDPILKILREKRRLLAINAFNEAPQPNRSPSIIL